MRILLVTTRFPLPPRRGQQVRTVEWLRALGGDHEVVCVCPRTGDRVSGSPDEFEGVRFETWRDGSSRRAAAVVKGAVLGSMPVQEALYATGSARGVLTSVVQSFAPDLVIVQMVRCGWAVDVVDRIRPGTPILFDAIDAMGLHFDRAAAGMPVPSRMAARIEAGRCRRRERLVAERAVLTVAVSGRDLEALAVEPGRGSVIPVSGNAGKIVRTPSEHPTILLSGNLGYRPTVEGARWFGNTVWPALFERIPDARWVLAGARPARAIRKLGGLPGVEVYGDVEDLGPYLAEAWVSIAPMASGSGVPMKVLEAWAAGIPVVAHPWTAAGLDEGAGDGLEVADGIERWVEALAALLKDPERWETVARAGRAAWERSYRPEVIAEAIRETVAEAVVRSTRRPEDD